MEIAEISKAILGSFKDLDQFHAAILLSMLALGVVALSLIVIWYAIKRRAD